MKYCRISESILINAPVERVFEYAADWQRWEEWFEGVSDFTSSTELQRGAGARYRYKARILGISATVETEIHDFEENVGWTGVATQGMPHRTQWVFEAQGSTTKFTYILDFHVPVPLLGVIVDVLLLGPQWRSILRKSLDNLRVKLEEERVP